VQCQSQLAESKPSWLSLLAESKPSLAEFKLSQAESIAHPNPLLACSSRPKGAGVQHQLFGTQPRNTQVPPTPPLSADDTNASGSSTTATRAPVEPHEHIDAAERRETHANNGMAWLVCN